MLSYDILKEKPTLIQVFTTLTQAEFLDLLVEFKRQWNADKQTRSKRRKTRKRGGGRKLGLTSIADRLLFVLSYLKLYLIQELHAFLFNLNQSQTNRLNHRSATVLKQALGAQWRFASRNWMCR